MKTAQSICYRGLLWLLALQLISWALLPGLLVESLPLDVVEGVYWGQEWQWGYYKHPPLPAWILYLFERALGDVGPFLLSQLCIGLTLLCVWHLGCRTLDRERAAFGVLALLACISLPGPPSNSTTMWHRCRSGRRQCCFFTAPSARIAG